jgi:hypothetical protein
MNPRADAQQDVKEMADGCDVRECEKSLADSSFFEESAGETAQTILREPGNI